mgnify:CR=1 FL=1
MFEMLYFSHVQNKISLHRHFKKQATQYNYAILKSVLFFHKIEPQVLQFVSSKQLGETANNINLRNKSSCLQ